MRWARSSAMLEADVARRAPRGRRAASARLREEHDLDERAAENLLADLEDEREATGSLPTDKRIVLERFRDELGDWRLTLLTPFGGRVHAPWSMAIEAVSPSASASRSRRSGPMTGSPSGCPRATRRSTASRRCSSPRPMRSRTWSSVRSASSRCSRAGSVRMRHEPYSSLVAGRDPDAALAATPAGRRPARGRLALRQLPHPRRDLPRVPERRLRPARAPRSPFRRRAARDRDP